MTYRDLRAKLESLGCRFRRQADETTKCGSTPPTGGGRSSPGTAIVTWPRGHSTRSEETWESPGRISTRRKPSCPVHHFQSPAVQWAPDFSTPRQRRAEPADGGVVRGGPATPRRPSCLFVGMTVFMQITRNFRRGNRRLTRVINPPLGALSATIATLREVLQTHPAVAAYLATPQLRRGGGRGARGSGRPVVATA